MLESVIVDTDFGMSNFHEVFFLPFFRICKIVYIAPQITVTLLLTPRQLTVVFIINRKEHEEATYRFWRNFVRY